MEKEQRVKAMCGSLVFRKPDSDKSKPVRGLVLVTPVRWPKLFVSPRFYRKGRDVHLGAEETILKENKDKDAVITDATSEIGAGVLSTAREIN